MRHFKRSFMAVLTLMIFTFLNLGINDAEARRSKGGSPFLNKWTNRGGGNKGPSALKKGRKHYHKKAISSAKKAAIWAQKLLNNPHSKKDLLTNAMLARQTFSDIKKAGSVSRAARDMYRKSQYEFKEAKGDLKEGDYADEETAFDTALEDEYDEYQDEDRDEGDDYDDAEWDDVDSEFSQVDDYQDFDNHDD